MKLLISILFLTITIPMYSQSKEILELIKITSQGLKEKQYVSYDKEIASLIVGDWIIPVSKNSHVKTLNGHEVEFLLQNNTAVKSFVDSNVKKASFTLSFNSRKSAKEFIIAFKKAA